MRFGLSLSDFRQRLTETKKTLYGIRAKRIWPGRDEKILTSWNALMIGAFARAGAAFQVPEYLRAAERAAEFVLTRLRDSHGRLFRTCSESGQAKLAGYLEDYAFLAEALITLAESACQPRWLIPAIELTESMIRHFADVERGGFYATADDHESLIARTKDLHDGSIPSGNAVAAMVLLKLFPITGRINYRDLGEKTLQCYAALMDEQPMASGALLNAFDFHRGPVEELVIVGPRTETQQVAGTLLAAGLRNRLLVVHDPSDGAPAAELTLLHDRPLIDGQVTLYRCRNGVCETPFVGLAAIRAALGLGHDRV